MNPARDWQVAVPTHSRTDQLSRFTLRLLAERNVPRDRVTVFVSDPDQYEDYLAATDRGLYGQMVVGGKGIVAQRNHMARHYPVGTRLVQIDDDIRDVKERRSAKETAPVADLARLYTEAFQTLDTHGAHIWGIYPVNNPFFMKPQVRTDLCYIIAAMYGFNVRGDDCELVRLHGAEDQERSLQFHARDGALARLEWITLDTRYYKEPGGLQDYRTAQMITRDRERLFARYPDKISLYQGKDGNTEVRFRRGKK